MANVSFLRPADQPLGRRRLLDELRTHLRSADFNELRFVVAFAKLGPLLRLKDDIARWSQAGKVIKAIFGIDQKGTSRQVLEFALDNFQETHVAYSGNYYIDITFHPKIYLFSGAKRVLGYVGSNNLTVGGTEINFEAFTCIDMDRTTDAGVVTEFTGLWDDTLQAARLLDRPLLAELLAANLLADEAQSQRRTSRASAVAAGGPAKPKFPKLAFRPPSAIPRSAIQPKTKQPTRTPAVALPATTATVGAAALVIQITAHHNGEIFLSKGAVNQDPAFFGWPFTGNTVPKKAANPSYPQRTPDPVVVLKVYDANGGQVLTLPPFGLNTVYYSEKSEIRITVRPEVVRIVRPGPPYSIMVMRQAADPLDYEIDIYLPGSTTYDAFRASCNQKMPSGGKSTPRYFGWL